MAAIAIFFCSSSISTSLNANGFGASSISNLPTPRTLLYSTCNYSANFYFLASSTAATYCLCSSPFYNSSFCFYLTKTSLFCWTSNSSLAYFSTIELAINSAFFCAKLCACYLANSCALDLVTSSSFCLAYCSSAFWSFNFKNDFASAISFAFFSWSAN